VDGSVVPHHGVIKNKSEDHASHHVEMETAPLICPEKYKLLNRASYAHFATALLSVQSLPVPYRYQGFGHADRSIGLLGSFSRIASQVRPTASPLPLIVWTKFRSPSQYLSSVSQILLGRYRILALLAWKSRKLEARRNFAVELLPR